MESRYHGLAGMVVDELHGYILPSLFVLISIMTLQALVTLPVHLSTLSNSSIGDGPWYHGRKEWMSG